MPQIAETLRHERPLTSNHFTLEVNPNPFNQRSLVSFNIGSPDEVKLSVYDITGREVAILAEGWRPAGKYLAEWDGKSCASGIYFIYLTSKTGSIAKKIILTK